MNNKEANEIEERAKILSDRLEAAFEADDKDTVLSVIADLNQLLEELDK